MPHIHSSDFFSILAHVFSVGLKKGERVLRYSLAGRDGHVCIWSCVHLLFLDHFSLTFKVCSMKEFSGCQDPRWK